MGSKNKNKKRDGKRAEGSAVGSGGGKIITDSRFAAVHSDPRFQQVPKHKSKVAIDSRFDSVFSDKRFSSSTAPLDKRGRPKKRGSQNPLRHYYRMEECREKEDAEEEQESGSRGSERGTDVAKTADLRTELEKSESGSESESEDGAVSAESESVSEDEAASAESESTTDTDEEDEGGVSEEEEAEPQEESIPVIEKETRRLAVVNMDWRHVKAADLYVLLSSFLPKEGQILSVAIYPSEFGLQQMKEEEANGPVGLFDEENDDDDENEDDIDNEKLRAYERSRLRYYYAVVECDSTATADYLYNACDGVEFERSSNVLDLRFIPDSMEFKHLPRDVATKAPANYDGLDFQTRALQQSEIHLTWDEDEPDRTKTLKRKLNPDQLAELELREFLASDDSGSDEDDENENLAENQSDKKDSKREKYLALLQGDGDYDGNQEDDESKQDLEITFNSGLEDLSKRLLEKKEQKSESVFEANLRKRREKKKMMRKNRSKDSSDDEEDGGTDSEGTEEPGDFFMEEPPTKKMKKAGGIKAKKADKEQQDAEAAASKAELELLVADENGEGTGPKGYKIKRKKAKGKKGIEGAEEDVAKIPTADYNDPRFAAVFNSPLFALDPTDPHYKRSAAYLRQVALNRQKGGKQEPVGRESEKPQADPEMPSLEIDEAEAARSDPQPSKKEKHELSSLVKSLKMKSKQVQLPKKGGNLQLRGETRRKVEKEKQRHRSPGMESVKKKRKNKD